MLSKIGSNNPNFKHGLRNTRLFSIWANIKSRCNNSNIKTYQRYGQRGISICDEWLNDFKAFYNWAINNGYSDELTIDRKDNDKNYSPDNCRWVTMKTQSRNTRRNHLVTIDNKTMTLVEWCDFFQINYHTVQDRIRRGLSELNALTTPIDTRFRKKVG